MTTKSITVHVTEYRSQNFGQFVGSLAIQTRCALAKTDNGLLLVQRQRHYDRYGLGVVRYRGRNLLWLIDNDCSGSEIAQALKSLAHENRDATERVAARQRIDESNQVAQQRARPTDGSAVNVHYTEAQGAFSRRCAVIKNLEQDVVKPKQGEHAYEHHSAAKVVQKLKGDRYDDEGGKFDNRIDQPRQRSRGKTSNGQTKFDALWCPDVVCRIKQQAASSCRLGRNAWASILKTKERITKYFGRDNHILDWQPSK